MHNFWEFKFWQWSRQTKLDMLTMSQNLTDWNIGHKIMHFLTVLLDSMLELNSSQIFLHTFLDSLLSSNWWFSAVFALPVTIFNTSPSFYLSYHFFFEEDCLADSIHKNMNKNAVDSACFHWNNCKTGQMDWAKIIFFLPLWVSEWVRL